MFDLTRLESLAKTKGISKTHLCSLVGRPKYYLNDIKNKGTQAPDDYIEVWAQTLNTTPEYLKGETDEKEKPAALLGDELTDALKDPQIYKLVQQLINAPKEERDRLERIVDAALENPK